MKVIRIDGEGRLLGIERGKTRVQLNPDGPWRHKEISGIDQHDQPYALPTGFEVTQLRLRPDGTLICKLDLSDWIVEETV